MSLNWKEIDAVLSEMDLAGSQIQKVVQSAYDALVLQTRHNAKTTNLLVVLSGGVCRLHETFREVVKNDRPLRFAEFVKSRLVNGWIEEAVQLGDDRIVRLKIRRGEHNYRMYIRLWSNAANIVVTDEAGCILDAMRRLPKRGEVSGGVYAPEAALPLSAGQGVRYAVRELPGAGSFSERLDTWYAEHGQALSLESLREQARRTFEGRIGRLSASLQHLREKEAEYAGAERLKEAGDIIMANIAQAKNCGEWLDAEDFYHDNAPARIRLDPKKGAVLSAEGYYEQYRKAKNGLDDVRRERGAGEEELRHLEETLARLLAETNPLYLAKLLRTQGEKPARKADAERPGLSFRRGEWLLIVGRDAAENDALLRRHVKGNDLWLHVRDYAGSYVFVKQRAGKSVPLDILLDAGHLALFYSKGRNNAQGDLFYTPVKYLRRAKGGPKGLVIPTQEKNLHINLEEARLKELEKCRIGQTLTQSASRHRS